MSNYRESKIPKSVCVYTVAQESRYLIIENLSTIGKISDFISHCKQFGNIESYRCLDTHENSDKLFNVLLLKFDMVSSSRYAKRKLDNKPYDYHLLRANYAPEHESLQDIRTKFNDRLLSVSKRLDFNPFKPKKKYKEKQVHLKQENKVFFNEENVGNKNKRRRI